MSAGTEEGADRPQEDAMSTVNQRSDYSTENFPVMVCRHGHWNIWRNANGSCAAIPSEAGERAGCRASQFGDMTYVRQVLAREILDYQDEQAMAFAVSLATAVPA